MHYDRDIMLKELETALASSRLVPLDLEPEEDGTSICLRAYYVNKVCVVCN